MNKTLLEIFTFLCVSMFLASQPVRAQQKTLSSSYTMQLVYIFEGAKQFC